MWPAPNAEFGTVWGARATVLDVKRDLTILSSRAGKVRVKAGADAPPPAAAAALTRPHPWTLCLHAVDAQRRPRSRSSLPRSVCGTRVASDSRAPCADAPCCTTSFENAHGTIFRELLYPWHPWFAHRVAIHEAIGNSNDLVFHCTLSGSDTGRSVAIPAWMFDRAICAATWLTVTPYVTAAALSALYDLLWCALRDPPALSSEPASGVSRASSDQHRREAHACQQNGMPDQAGEPATGRRAAARSVRRSPKGHSGYASVAGTAGGDTGNADRSDGAADPKACRCEPPWIGGGGRS